MANNHTREVWLSAGNKDYIIEEGKQELCEPIHLENSSIHLESRNDARRNEKRSPGPKFCRKRPKDTVTQQFTAENSSGLKHNPRMKDVPSPRVNSNRLSTISASTPAAVPTRKCITLNPDSLKALRESCKCFDATVTPAVPVRDLFRFGESKVLSSKELTPEVSLILRPTAEVPQRLSNGISNDRQAPSEVNREVKTTTTADSERAIVDRQIRDPKLSVYKFSAALSVFPVERKPERETSASVKRRQINSRGAKVIDYRSTDAHAQLPRHGDGDSLPQPSWKDCDPDPDPPVLSVVAVCQEDEMRQLSPDSESPPPLSPVLANQDDCENSGVTPSQQPGYPINFRVNRLEETLPYIIPQLSQGIELPISQGTEITNRTGRKSLQGAFMKDAREAKTEIEYHYVDAEPSTSGLHMHIPVATDMDVSDSDGDDRGDDREYHLRVNLYPPLFKSPSKRKIAMKGSSKFRSSRDKPRNNQFVNYAASNNLSSPDIDPQQVPGFASISCHGLQVGPSNSAITRELYGIREISPSFSSTLIMGIFVLFNSFMSNLDLRRYADVLSTSTAFNDTTDLQVGFRRDVTIRFAVCQVCGVPRYLERVGKWQVWSPVETHVCGHSEPHHYGADFIHMWWNRAQQSGLVPINPSLFPFSVLFARLGDLAELTLAALVVNGVIPILNRKDVPSDWPLGRQAYVETDEELERTVVYAFVKWTRDNEQVVTSRPPRLCPLCGGRANDYRSHLGSRQPLECKAVVNLMRHKMLVNRVRHLVQHRRPIVWTGRPSVQALLHALNSATIVQIDAAAILFCLIGAVLLTHDERYPQLLNAGAFINARSL